MSSKRFKKAAELIDPLKVYTLDEALPLLKQTSTTKFDSSVEVHVRLGIDPSKAEQTVRSTAQLPHSTGKKLRIAVFAKGPAAAAATKAGAAMVGDDELIAEVKKTGAIAADIVLATPDMMKSLAPVAKTLGTKGLMPNPKNETVTADPAAMIKALETGKISFRSDANGNVHQLIGKISASPEQLKENIVAFIDALKKAKPATQKGTYIKNLVVCSAMGPSIRIQEV